MTHDDQPTFEPMRKPDMPPANRNSPRRTYRRPTSAPDVDDDSPYLVDRLQEMDRKLSWIDRVRERKNRSANG